MTADRSMDLSVLEAQLLVSRQVEIAEGRGFGVSGLPLDGIVAICQRHWEQATALFDDVIAKVGGELDLEQTNWIGGALLSTVPDLAADIIAVAAGYPAAEAAAVFRKLPFPVQLAALENIAELTFTSEMPPKKVIETVARILVGIAKPLSGASQPEG